MSFPRYPRYKDSGVEWLGEVPEHWEVRRLGFYFAERREKVSDRDFPPLSVTRSGIVPQLETAAKTDDGENRKKVCCGDFVINSRSDRKGSSGISKFDGSVSLISTVILPQEALDPMFVHHLLRSQPFQEEYYRFGKGIVADLWSTSYSEMRNIVLAVPPSSEQQEIGSFVEREATKIDALVTEQQRLIELLKEKRQAVISHAVTRGLNPDVPMKPSGVEWLGDVPAHWTVCQLGKLCRAVSDGPHFSPPYVDDGIPFLSARNVKVNRWDFADVKYIAPDLCDEFDRRVIPEVGDILYTKGGTTGIARVVDLEYRFQVWVHIAVLKIHRNVADPSFLAFTLNGSASYEQSQLYTRGATNQDLGLTRMIRIMVTVPPVEEQLRIVHHLNTQLRVLDTLLVEAEFAITLLQERRTALISAAVTGKIDVCGLADRAA
jgi:type I restriction enzyme S subunit